MLDECENVAILWSLQENTSIWSFLFMDIIPINSQQLILQEYPNTILYYILEMWQAYPAHGVRRYQRQSLRLKLTCSVKCSVQGMSNFFLWSGSFHTEFCLFLLSLNIAISVHRGSMSHNLSMIHTENYNPWSHFFFTTRWRQFLGSFAIKRLIWWCLWFNHHLWIPARSQGG